MYVLEKLTSNSNKKNLIFKVLWNKKGPAGHQNNDKTMQNQHVFQYLENPPRRMVWDF